MYDYIKLLNLSRLQMLDSARSWYNSDFDPFGTIIICKNAVFQDMPTKNTTYCFSFDNILTLEYKRIIVNFHERNHEVSGISTLVCDTTMYQKIKEAWIAYHGR